MDVKAQYMTTTKLGKNGKLTVPKRLRKQLGLNAGSRLVVLRLGDGLVLLPEQRHFDQLCERVRSTLMAVDITADDTLASLPAARNRVYARRYRYCPKQ